MFTVFFRSALNTGRLVVKTVKEAVMFIAYWRKNHGEAFIEKFPHNKES